MPVSPGESNSDVVAGADLAVWSGLQYGAFGLDAGRGARQAERVVAGADDAVHARRQEDGSAQVADDEPGALGRHVADHQRHAEELVQETDVARDDDDAGDRRHDERLAAGARVKAQREADDTEVRDARLDPQGVGDQRLHGPQQRHVHVGQVDRGPRVGGRQQRRQHHGELDVDLRAVLDRERRREVVGLEAACRRRCPSRGSRRPSAGGR